MSEDDDGPPPAPPVPLPPLPPRRGRWTLGPVFVLVLVNVLGIGAWLRVKGDQDRMRASWRACWHQQKMLTDAIEVYKLDKSLVNPKLILNADLLATLIKGGYASSVSVDPGAPYGTWKYYALDPKGSNRVYCQYHGAFWERESGWIPDVEEPRKPVKTPPRAPPPFVEKEAEKMADSLHEAALREHEP